MNTLSEYEYVVRSYECYQDGLATLPSVCNYLQEAASVQAMELGFSKRNFEAMGLNISWVLIRWHFRMFRYPKWREKVTVLTFPRGGRRVVAYRDFEMRVGDELIGVATSEWAVIDLALRKAVAVPQMVFDLANDERRPVLPPEEAFSRYRWDCREVCGGLRFKAPRGDIDLNGHVNNVHYIEWVMEALPDSAIRPRDFEITFKTETMVGDEVVAEGVETAPGTYLLRVANSDGTGDHVVAVAKA